MPLRANLCWMLLLGVGGQAAAQALEALRVDPALLRAPGPAVRRSEAAAPMLPTPASARIPAPVVSAPARTQAAAARPTSPVADDTATRPAAPLAAAAVEPPLVAERTLPAPLYSAYVAAGELPEPVLMATPRLDPPPPKSGDRRPAFITADHMDGRIDVELRAEGAVELRKLGTVVNADRLTYAHVEDEVDAEGHVRLERGQDVIAGPKMRMRVDEGAGYMETPSYTITRMINPLKGLPQTPGMPLPASVPMIGHGEAEYVEFEGEGRYRFRKATYSTCAPGQRDWYLELAELGLDYERDLGEGEDSKVVFMGVPILYSPWMNFGLNNQRKSGLLAPTIGSTSKSGMEYTQPVYWNIAPNMDATIAPRFMDKRGTQFNTEFRYLDHTYDGQMHYEYLPDDRLEHKRRYGYALSHTHKFGDGLTGSLNLNGVSDDTYFSDLSTRLSVVSQGNLLRQGTLKYQGGWWQAKLNAQTYQTLQDPALPVALIPYKQLPQINVVAARPDLPLNLAFNFQGEYVNFDHPTSVLGRRTTLYPQLSLPLQTSYFEITPKIGLHSTSYQLSRQAAGTPDTLSRNVPILSLDSSLVLERETSVFGRGLTQTLEPRLYYLYVQNREQDKVPVFDSALADFNFAQIFSENRYGGGDRIGDANQVTAALTSRLIDRDTGAELLRGMVGQRYYFSSQQVTLPGETTRTDRKADVLAALSGLVLPKVYADAAWQYNPRDKRTERLNLGGRYQPEFGKVLNAGYRYTRDQLGQVDVSGQWPLWGGWHAVGRYNYSTKERRVVETVGGLEYDGGCWITRAVVQRIATQVGQSNTAFFLQLELNGFSRIGSNPLDILKRNIPGYGLINQPTSDPVFGAY
jgi:LPS-assembly protein